MLNTGVPAEEIATFCTDLGKFHHLQESDIALLLQFVKALDITGPSNDGVRRVHLAAPYRSPCSIGPLEHQAMS